MQSDQLLLSATNAGASLGSSLEQTEVAKGQEGTGKRGKRCGAHAESSSELYPRAQKGASDHARPC